MGDLQQIRLLKDPRNLSLFLKILLGIASFRVLIVCMKLPSLLESLDRSSRLRRPFEREDLERARLAWKYANFFLLRCLRVRNPCLLRSLTLFRLFRKAGFDVQIYFGVKKNGSLLEGHSWLLLNGDLLLEQRDPQITYTEIYSYPNERDRFQSIDQNP